MNSLDYHRIFHEIKNSITLINSSIQLLNSKCPQLEYEPYWDNVKEEITYLKNMVLQISQAGNMEQLQKEPIALNPMLQSIYQSMKDTFPYLQWNLQLDETIPTICGDSIKLRQAVINILKNSAETHSDSITIATEYIDGAVKISVTDFGGGIPAELEHKVFDLFISSKKQGNGLGLAITKQIVEHHGGTLVLDNHPGTGCTFAISLPAISEYTCGH